jgi:sugar lactone lactonase YvrE
MLTTAFLAVSGGIRPAAADGVRMAGSIQGKPLPLSGTVTTLAGRAAIGAEDGAAALARFHSPQGIATDGKRLYVADSDNHTIRAISIETGAVSTLAGSPGSRGTADGVGAAARFDSPEGLATDGTILYVADFNNHAIRKVEIATGAVTTLAGKPGVPGQADGVGVAAGFNSPFGVAMDAECLYVADTANCTIRKVALATGAVTTLTGVPGVRGASDGGSGATPMFAGPTGIARDGRRLYVSDLQNKAVRTVDLDTGAVTTLPAKLLEPYGIAAAAGFLYVADSEAHAIRKIDAATGVSTILAGSGWAASGSRDGTGDGARFAFPYGVAVAGPDLYVADAGNHLVRRVAIASGVVTTFAGTVSEGVSDGVGAAARFEFPRALAAAGTDLYVADSANQTIRKVAVDTGTVTTLAGVPAGGGGWTDGPAASARFTSPVGITTDGTHLYVVDLMNGLVRKVARENGAVSTLAGKPVSFAAKDGPAAEAEFSGPAGVTTDGKDLYVAEAVSHTIRKVSIATGAVTTVAGSSGKAGAVDGTGAAARFNAPTGITTDGTDLYVADANNNAIRKVSIATGAVTTFAGTARGAAGAADGTGGAARFNGPKGIATDGAFLYVADTNNHSIRKVSIATRAVTTLAGNGASGFADGAGAAARFSLPCGVATDGVRLFVADSGNNAIREVR